MDYDTNIQTDGYECSECKELGERLRAKAETALDVEATIAGLNTSLSSAVEEGLELQAENEKLKGIVLLFDNYCRVNDIDMEQFLKS